MRVLFCGGRDFKDKTYLYEVIQKLKPTYVITGGAKGADSMANGAAEYYGIPRVIFPANWEGEGKLAGPLRNKRMLVEGKPDLVFAFEGGRGTDNMIKQAKEQGVPVRTEI